VQFPLGDFLRKKEFTTHIILEENQDGKLLITVDDYELFDIIDDILTEQFDIDFLLQNLEVEYVLHLENTNFDTVDDILSSLDECEIERIFRLNN
jgi:hypothetical protein